MSRLWFEAIPEVGEQVTRAPHLFVCLDFDGTLTPIVDDPASVCLAPPVQRVLRALANQAGVSVAVISGRNRADLQARVGIPGLMYAGNHGLEISGPGCLFVEPTAASCCATLKLLAAELAENLQHIPGAFVEDKGLTLSVHYRRVAVTDYQEVRRLVDATLASRKQLFRLSLGAKVYEIRPQVDWHKGTAVAWIKEQLGKPDALVIYLGDDATDEDAMAVLGEGITVKVGGCSPTAAHYQLEGPAEVLRFLEWLERSRNLLQ